VPRFVIVLLTVLLLAAPVDSAPAEIADASCMCDEEVVMHTYSIALDNQPRLARAPCADDAIPPAPAPSTIFRPPRSAFE
jgi:hypothetical protein